MYQTLKFFTIMKHTGICIASLVGGMVLGSALAMLFTPQSGPELRQSIRDLIVFALCAIMAILLLLMALVVWLSEVTGSLILAATLVGAFFAVLSAVIYWLALKDAIQRIGAKLDTVYDVAHTVQIGYEWVLERLSLWLGQGQRES